MINLVVREVYHLYIFSDLGLHWLFVVAVVDHNDVTFRAVCIIPPLFLSLMKPIHRG